MIDLAAALSQSAASPATPTAGGDASPEDFASALAAAGLTGVFGTADEGDGESDPSSLEELLDDGAAADDATVDADGVDGDALTEALMAAEAARSTPPTQDHRAPALPTPVVGGEMVDSTAADGAENVVPAATAVADAAPDVAVAPQALPAPTDAATTNLGAGAPATQPIETPETATTPSAPAAPQEADVPAPAQQIADALRDVRRLADGTHRLSLQLRPAELGTVQLEIALRDGQLHLHAVAESERTARAIEAALPELRGELRDAGVEAGSLEVRDHATGRHGDPRNRSQGRTDRSANPRPPSEPTTTQPTDRPSTSSLVDLRL